MNNPTDSSLGRVESSTQPPFQWETDEPKGETPSGGILDAEGYSLKKHSQGCVVAAAGRGTTL